MSNIQLAITNPDYKQWINNIEQRFRQQQIKAAAQVNSSKIEFYWSLGRDICEIHVEEQYGEKVIDALSKDLRNVIPDATGLTPVNLYYCKRFYLFYSQMFQKVPHVEKSIQEDKNNILEQINGHESKCLYSDEKAKAIDQKIFDLYGLTQEERDMVGYIDFHNTNDSDDDDE